MPWSLRTASRLNANRWQSLADLAVAGDGSGRLARLRETTQSDGVISSNVNTFKVLTFDRVAAVLPARRLSGLPRRQALRDFRRRQGSDFRGRARFEALWVGGREFVYGAVNIGGPGILDYGSFGLTWLEPDKLQGPTAVFPRNTGRDYVRADGSIDRDQARKDVAAWNQRGDVVTHVRRREAPSTPETDWPLLVCSSAGFVEANIVGPVPVDTVDTVRLTADVSRRLHLLRARYIASSFTLTDAERNDVAALSVLRRRERAGALRIKIV